MTDPWLRRNPDPAFVLRADVERLRAEHAEMAALLAQDVAAPERMQVIMRREGFVLDDLTDPMQKLAFTFYSELCERASAADDALARIQGEAP